MERKTHPRISLINNSNDGRLVWLICCVPGTVICALQAPRTIDARTPWSGDNSCSHFTGEKTESCSRYRACARSHREKNSRPPSLCNDEGHALGLLLFSLFSFDMSQVLSPFSCKPGSSQQGGSDRSASRNHRVTFLGVILLFPVPWLYELFIRVELPFYELMKRFYHRKPDLTAASYNYWIEEPHKESTCNAGDSGVWSLDKEDPLKKEMATHSSILAWEIPWAEEPGGLQSMGSQSVGHDWRSTAYAGGIPKSQTGWNALHFQWGRKVPATSPPIPSLTLSLTVAVVQSLSCVWLFVTPWTAAHQASLTFTISQICSNSCPLSQWCHPTISSSVIPFSSCPPSFPAWGSFPMSRLFASSGQSIGASTSASVLPMNMQGWFPLGLTRWISLQSKGLSRVFSSTTIPRHQFFSAQPSLWSNSHIRTWLLEKTIAFHNIVILFPAAPFVSTPASEKSSWEHQNVSPNSRTEKFIYPSLH